MTQPIETKKLDLTDYLSAVNTIVKDLRLDAANESGEKTYLDVQLAYMDNYFDQSSCLSSLDTYDARTSSDALPEDDLDEDERHFISKTLNIQIEKKELKKKLLFKLNCLLNEKFDEINRIFERVEENLNKMNNQLDTIEQKMSQSKQLDGNNNEISYDNIFNSMKRINKTFWNNFYILKDEFKFDHLQTTKNTQRLREKITSWLQNDLAHLKIDLELCRHFSRASVRHY